jgi:hypothetical protein
MGVSHTRRDLCDLPSGHYLKRKFRNLGDYFALTRAIRERKHMSSMLRLLCIEVS